MNEPARCRDSQEVASEIYIGGIASDDKSTVEPFYDALISKFGRLKKKAMANA